MRVAAVQPVASHALVATWWYVFEPTCHKYVDGQSHRALTLAVAALEFAQPVAKLDVPILFVDQSRVAHRSALDIACQIGRDALTIAVGVVNLDIPRSAELEQQGIESVVSQLWWQSQLSLVQLLSQDGFELAPKLDH